MKQEVRNSYIARLSEEISGSLAGTNFERFGYIISDHYFSDYEMINKGTNVDGAPVGYIVDSVSTDASVVTEYSSDKDYFSNLKKIKNDIKHSFNHCKGSLTKLLLFGSRALIMPWSIVAKPPQASGRGALPVEVVVEPAKPAKACVQALAQTKADEVVQRSVPPGWSHQIGRWRNYAAP